MHCIRSCHPVRSTVRLAVCAVQVPNHVMPGNLSSNEEAQLQQTIEMFEVITQSQPLDYQSLEILKEAYFKLGRQKEVVNTSKRIAQAYVQMGQLSSAILEYESVLQLFPDDPEVLKALSEIANQATSLGTPPAQAPEVEPVEKSRLEPPKPTVAGPRTAPTDLDDGRKPMHTLLVEGKLVSEADFTKHWPTARFDQEPDQPASPFVLVLADQGLLPLEKSMKLLCEKTRLGYLPLDKYDVDVELARTFPKAACRRWCVLPFDHMSKSVLVATANPFNKQAARDLEGATRNRLLWYLAPPAEIVRMLRKVFR